MRSPECLFKARRTPWIVVLITPLGICSILREQRLGQGREHLQHMDYPRVQILTVKEVVEEKKRFLTPTKLGTKALPDQTRLPV